MMGDEFIWIAPGYKCKGYGKCFVCNTNINFINKIETNIKKLYVELKCPQCGLFNRLPIFKVTELAKEYTGDNYEV